MLWMNEEESCGMKEGAEVTPACFRDRATTSKSRVMVLMVPSAYGSIQAFHKHTSCWLMTQEWSHWWKLQPEIIKFFRFGSTPQRLLIKKNLGITKLPPNIGFGRDFRRFSFYFAKNCKFLLQIQDNEVVFYVFLLISKDQRDQDKMV